MAMGCIVLAQPALREHEGHKAPFRKLLLCWSSHLSPLLALPPQQTLHGVRALLSPSVCLSGGAHCRQL